MGFDWLGYGSLNGMVDWILDWSVSRYGYGNIRFLLGIGWYRCLLVGMDVGILFNLVPYCLDRLGWCWNGPCVRMVCDGDGRMVGFV